MSSTATDTETAAQPQTQTLTISHSQCETLDKCEHKWYLQKRARVRQVPRDSFVLGHAVHETIEAYLRERAARPHAPLDLDATRALLGAHVETRIEQHLVAEDINGYLMREYARLIVRARAIVDVFVAQIARHVVVAHSSDGTPLVEHQFALALPGLEHVRVVGTIDAISRVTNRETGEITHVALDWKSSAKPYARDWERDAQQASIYALACDLDQRLPPIERLSFVTFPLVRHSETQMSRYFDAHARTVGRCARLSRTDEAALAHATYLDVRIARRDATHKRKTITMLVEKARRIETLDAGHAVPRVQTSPLCGWCEVRAHCEQGRAYVERRLPIYRERKQQIVPTLDELESGAFV